MMQRSPRSLICATRSEIRTVLPEPVVPETMVCCVSALFGQGTPATRGRFPNREGKASAMRE